MSSGEGYWDEFLGSVRARSGRTLTKAWGLFGLLMNLGVLWTGWQKLGLDLRSLLFGQVALLIFLGWMVSLAFMAFRDAARQRDRLQETAALTLTYEGESPASNVISGPGQPATPARFTRAAFRNDPRQGGIGRTVKNLTARVTFYRKDGTFVGLLKHARFAESDERFAFDGERWIAKSLTSVWTFNVPAGAPATLDLVCRYETDGRVFPWSNDGKGPPLELGESYFVVAELTAEGTHQQVEYFLLDVPEKHDILLHRLSEQPRVLNSRDPRTSSGLP